MSDGNFNRSLLPHNPYHSGLQAGKAMARMKAIEAFKAYLLMTDPDMDEQGLTDELERYKKLLSEKLK